MLETTPGTPQDAASPGTDAQTQQLVLRTLAREADSLLRTARRHSLCADDAHDAYQRSMEIFMRRAASLDPQRAGRWLHVVVKHEAMALRKRRCEVVSTDDVDFERHEAVHQPTPEEQAIGADRTARAAEALRRLKPQELRALWLRALGKSYAEICDETGWSHTKVNRCLAEGRKSFLQRFAGIEAGEECGRWEPVLSAVVDGEATAAQLGELRPHLRNCPSCRATVRALHEARGPLSVVLPAGLLAAGAKLSGLLSRVVPAFGGGDAGVAGGGAGVLGAGGAKLAGLLAAGAVATAGGGGLVVAEHHHAAAARHVRVARTSDHASARSTPAVGAAAPVVAAAGSAGAPAGAVRPDERPVTSLRSPRRRHVRLAAHRRHDGRVEFRPAGAEPAPGRGGSAPSSATVATAATATAAPESTTPSAPSTGSAPAPTGAPASQPSSTAAPEPVLAPSRSTADSTGGEFAPGP